MIEQQEQGADNLETAARLLKGIDETASQKGREQLQSYGYLNGQGNRLSRELEIYVRNILLISAALLLTHPEVRKLLFDSFHLRIFAIETLSGAHLINMM